MRWGRHEAHEHKIQDISQQAGQFLAETNVGNADLHLALGLPTDADPSDDILIRRSQYVTSYNNSTHNPNWVSYNLSAWWFGDAKRHRGEFLPDPDLGEQYFHTLHRDYTNSGYDRGHMCRSEERTRSDADNLTTFYTTNLLPQFHELNAGPWLRLEDYCEELCKRQSKELFVIDGPIYSSDMGTIGRGLKVPSECFKIIVVLDKGQGLTNVQQNTSVIAVRMPNSRDIMANDWRQYRCSIRAIESATGYDFLSKLPRPIQDALEQSQPSM